jgi:hypothetical protein
MHSLWIVFKTFILPKYISNPKYLREVFILPVKTTDFTGRFPPESAKPNRCLVFQLFMIDNAADDWRIAMTWQRMMQVSWK